MSLLFVRMCISAAIFAVPFMLLMLVSGGAYGGLWLLFPLVAAIPGALGAMILFAPMEALLDACRLPALKNLAVPLLGALIAPALLVFFHFLDGKEGSLIERLTSGGINVWGPIVLWMVLGVIFGVLWRLSARLAGKTGISNG